MPLKGPSYIPNSVTSAVILLHGYGSDGHDMMAVGDYWRRKFPETAFFAPHGPFPCEAYPVGYQWFSLGQWSDEDMTKGLENTYVHITSFISSIEASYDLKKESIILGGFSQGAMVSLYTACRLHLGGIVAYSGALYGSVSSPHQPCPIFLAHGMADTVVPLEGSQQAERIFQEKGYLVRSCFEANLGHTISPQGLKMGQDFIEEILKGGHHGTS
jgi:phospholipase/carboxylesterase